MSLAANATLWVEHGSEPWLLRAVSSGTIFVVETEAVRT
jgi:hypothetical protein